MHGYPLSFLGKCLILCLFFIHSHHYVLTHMGLIGIICLIMLERKTFFISVPFVAKYTFVCSKVWYYSAFHCVTLLIMIQYYNSRLNVLKGCNIEQHRKPKSILVNTQIGFSYCLNLISKTLQCRLKWKDISWHQEHVNQGKADNSIIPIFKFIFS